MSAVYYLDGDSAKSNSPDDSNDSCLQTIVESDCNETITFYWKVSSEEDGDYLQFYIDDTLEDQPADPRGGPDQRRGGLDPRVT